MKEIENIKVSIIVPVYNAVKYLETSVCSLINQTYKNIEIILIDDGSKDASLQVCNELAQKDPRIIVIHQENQGVSAARNNATKAASGHYVMYFDSDDVLAKHAIKKAVEYASEYDAELVIGAAVKIHSIEEFQTYDIESEAVHERLDNAQYDELRRQYFQCGKEKYSKVKDMGYFNRAPHAKLVRYDIASAIAFPTDTPIGEDLMWNLRLLSVCKTTVLVHDIWYGYVLYEASAVRRYHGDRATKVSEYLVHMKKENEDFFENNMDAYVRNVAVELYCIANYELMSPECPLSKEEKKEILKKLISREPWNILWQPGMKKYLPKMHQAMLPLYKAGGVDVVSGYLEFDEEEAESNTLVSIIVPVYNSSRTLVDCVKSIGQQTYRNIEIIIVDDGSTDDSLSVCKSLSENDRRIRVLHQTNQGVSVARNNGTIIAQGDYVMYMDSDDVLSSYAIESGLIQLKNYNLDMVVGACIRISTFGEFLDDDKLLEKKCEVFEDTDFDKIRLQYFGCGDKKLSSIDCNGYIMRGPIARLIRSDIAKSNLFPKGVPIGEDLMWNLNLLKICKRIGIQLGIWYGYVIHGGSAVRGYHADRTEKVSQYLLQMKNENEAFFYRYPEAYLKNVAIELYCIANYELLSKQCPLSTKQKIGFMKATIQKEPWCILYRDKNWTRVPMVHRIMLPLYRTGIWINVLKLKSIR